MDPKAILAGFDDFLAKRSLRFEGVIVGAAALNLLGIVSRATKDCDVLAPEIPPEIAEASRAFAVARRAAGEPLDEDWFNNGPRSLTADLPAGWEQRLQPLFNGRSLELRTLGRLDLLRAKLFALCDRGIDIGDCIALAPTADELRAIAPWLVARDGNPLWPEHVAARLASLAQRLGHAV
jgi:hypothetical protein